MKHGTTKAYHGGCRCVECRSAQADYMREYRRRGGIKRQVARQAERQRALAVLRDRHRDEYEAILADLRDGRDPITSPAPESTEGTVAS